MSDTVSVRKGDLDTLVAACTSWAPHDMPTGVGEAFSRMLNAFDEAHADDDAAASEPEPAKVIIVTETPFGNGAPFQRRYDANQTDTSSYGQMRLLRKGREVATYQSNAWLSVREDGAEVPDSPARALRIARRALTDIRDQYAPGTHAHDTAHAALDEIFAETE